MKAWISTRQVADLAVLAACNGALELTLGTFLHATHLPLAGSVMVGLNLVVYAVGHQRVPRRGAILAIGLGTAFLNAVFVGGFKLMALPAIVIEAAVLDLLLSSGGLGRLNLAIAGAISNLVALGWSLTTGLLVLGLGPHAALARLLHADSTGHLSLLALAGILVAVRIVVGVLFALLAWRVLGLVDSALEAQAEA